MNEHPKLSDVLALDITPEPIGKVGGAFITPVKFDSDLDGFFGFDDSGSKALVVGCFDGGKMNVVVVTDIKKPSQRWRSR